MQMHRIMGLLCFGLFGYAAIVPAQAADPAREVLPDTVIPLHYDLALAPDAQAMTFKGTVVITVSVTAPVHDIALNAVGLTFDRASLDVGAITTSLPDTKLGRETLHSSQPIAPGQHVLTIAYHGTIGRSTLGFFAMDYAGPDGPRRTLATNFEPASARQLFPCWDEPGRKATFTITVDAPKDRMAISNMPVARTVSLSDTMQRVTFARTPKMSTYLLFLGIGDYERIHRIADGVDVGVVVKRGDTPKASYALEQAVKVLHYYNSYFGTPFPLPKLDLVAAPGEISGGSMENWGAIFYSQEHLLFDPRASTESDRQLVFEVVAHEMAHQWFGDLVTMAWWDDLWLNEGFARWMQTYAADDLHPEWKTGLRALSIFERGKQADAIPSTHPVVQTVTTAEQAEQAFDNITYDKGAAVITMINAYVGRDAFRDGVRRYMKAHAYGNTVDSDLWSIMQRTAGKPILEIERDVTRQEGVPLIRVAAGTAAVTLSEGRFAEDPTTIADAPPQHWLLPVAGESLADGKPQTQLLRASARFTLAPPVLVNAGQTAYGRVLYAQDALPGLVAGMATLPAADQYGLLDDSLALGLAGYTSAGNALALLKALPADADPIVWSRAIVLLTQIDHHYPDGAAKAAYRRFALDLLKPLAQRLGLAARQGEDGNLQILRGALEEFEGAFGDEATLTWARQTMADPAAAPVDKRIALTVVASQADAATFDALAARARDEPDPLVKQHLYEALANVQNPALARRMLEIAFSGEPPAGTGPYLLLSLGSNHPDLSWEVALPHLQDAKLPLENSMRWRIAVSIAGLSSRPERIAAVEAYERTVPEPARRPFLGAVAAIRQNQHIREKAVAEMTQWIAAQNHN